MEDMQTVRLFFSPDDFMKFYLINLSAVSEDKEIMDMNSQGLGIQLLNG